MSDARKKRDRKVTICGRNLTYLPFADDIIILAEKEQERKTQVKVPTKSAQGIERRWRSVLRRQTNDKSTNCIQREIKVKEQNLATVTGFKFLGAVVLDNRSKLEILSNIAQATTVLTKRKSIWRTNKISLGSKVNLMRSRVIFVFLNTFDRKLSH